MKKLVLLSSFIFVFILLSLSYIHIEKEKSLKYDNKIKEAISKLHKEKLPYIVNDSTTWIDAKVENKNINYIFQTTLSEEKFKNEIFKIMFNGYCSQELTKTMLTNGFIYNIVYLNELDRKNKTLIIDKESCLAFN